MELRDGFIVGVFNYCDRWCERCTLTNYCRLFADEAEIHAALDPNLKAIVEAPPLPEDIPPPPPPWMRELIDEMNKAAEETTTKTVASEEWESIRPEVLPQHQPIEARAQTYSDHVHAWLTARDFHSVVDTEDPRAVVAWFHWMIPARVHRALNGLAEDDRDRDWPPDHDGSAKVALLAVEQSRDAWFGIVDRGLAPYAEIEPFVTDLVWLGAAIERVLPNARTFVRPAFDEPEELARLLAADGR